MSFTHSPLLRLLRADTIVGTALWLVACSSPVVTPSTTHSPDAMSCARANACVTSPDAVGGNVSGAPPVAVATAGVQAVVPAMSGAPAAALPALTVAQAPSAAGSALPPAAPPAAGAGPAPVDVGPGTSVGEPSDEATPIFDQTKLHTFEVEIAPSDLETINADPSSEKYVPAKLRFQGQTYAIGYRYKGSLGAFFPPCTNFLDGRKDGKCSVKMSFNWMVPEGRFFGLKKLLFHAMNNDPSMLRERLGYGLFREMGVPASRASHAILKVNGQSDVYALVEEIDSRFTRSRFTEGGKGNLYKEIWPIQETAQPYMNALETNDEKPAVERVLRFATAVKQGPAAMMLWMDPDVTLSYMAVDRVIMNDDGAFHFYCFDRAIGNNPKPPGNHNYYWYEAEKVDRLWIVPWDLDMAMNDTTQPPHLPTDWRKTPNPTDCAVCESGDLSGSPPSGCDPIIHNFQAWQALYEAKVDKLIAGPFNKAAVDMKLTTWKRQLIDAGFRVDEQAISSLQATLDRARMNRGFAY